MRWLIALLAVCVPVFGFAQTTPAPTAGAPNAAATPAAPAAAAPVAPAGVPAEAAVSRVEASLDFARLVTDEQFKEALPIGERLVVLTEQEFGKNSVQTGNAYVGLGDAQRRAGEHTAAEKSFLTSIEIFRSIEGPFSAHAITPLLGLGDNYRDEGEYPSAITAYSEARTVNRRTYGLLNAEQIVVLDRMTQTYVAMNQPLEADQQQLEALHLVERNNGPQSDEALDAIYKYAAWLRTSGRYQEERDQYARALRAIRDTHGEQDVRQVRPLLGIGNSFRNQRIPDGQGAGALRDALELLLAQPQHDGLAIAETLRDIGDWEVAFTKVAYNGDEYRRAWLLLGAVENGEQLRKAWFTGSNYVLREPISQRGLSQDAEALAGRVLVRFDLEQTGQTANAVVIESDPAGFKDEAVLRHIRRSRFRPQIVDGLLARGEGLALQFNYRYTPDALAAQQEREVDK